MMSFNEVSLSDVVQKQYSFKLKAFLGALGSLAILQLLALLFSLGGSMGSGFFGGHIEIEISYLSGNTVILFTILWAFVTAINMTTRAARYDDFTFVTNRLSSNIANLLYILTVSLIGGVSAILCGYILRVIGFFIYDTKLGPTIMDTPAEFFLAIGAVTLYVFLFGALGYLIGMLVQISRIFIVLLPATLIGAMMAGFISGYESLVKAVFDFIFMESNFGLFFIKVIVLSSLFFLAAFTLSNKLEVRK